MDRKSIEFIESICKLNSIGETQYLSALRSEVKSIGYAKVLLEVNRVRIELFAEEIRKTMGKTGSFKSMSKSTLYVMLKTDSKPTLSRVLEVSRAVYVLIQNSVNS